MQISIFLLLVVKNIDINVCMNVALISEWMKKNRLRIEDVASKTGLSYGTVARILAGKPAQLATAKVLADLMGVSLDDLLTPKAAG